MENITNPMSMATPFSAAWAPLTVAPIASVQGSGLPFAGYGAQASTALQHGTDVRPDAKGLPPRGRQH